MRAMGLTISVFVLALQQASPAPVPQRFTDNFAIVRSTSSFTLPPALAPVARDAAGHLSGLVAAVLPIPTAFQSSNPPAQSAPPADQSPPATRQFQSVPATGAPAQPGATRPYGNAAGGTRQYQYPSRQPAQVQPAQHPAPEPTVPDCGGFPCDAQPAKVVVANPPPAQPQWTWHEKIAWAAYVVLAILGYAGIMLALMMMKKIERQTLAAEAAAEAAQNSAHAALLHAQSVVDSERPWILVTVQPSIGVEDGFTVTATNRGLSPAKIAGTAERIRTAVDENHLPKTPEYDNREPSPPMVPIILLPGESTGLKSFSRADARGLCESDEQFGRIENWDERIYLYGKVVYRDLIAPADNQTHQTDWCCWYIHGRQKSGLVIAGPPGYNSHT